MANHLAPYHGTVTIGDLTERQAKFVQTYIECGTQRDGAIQAALTAGYGNGDRAQAKSRAYDLLHDSKVLAVLRDEISKKLSAAASLGVNVLIDLAQTAGSENVRLSAARELVDRGYGPVMSRNAPPPDPRKQSIEDFLNSLPLAGESHAEETDDAKSPSIIDAESEE